jgi:hypothetical protein
MQYSLSTIATHAASLYWNGATVSNLALSGSSKSQSTFVAVRHDTEEGSGHRPITIMVKSDGTEGILTTDNGFKNFTVGENLEIAFTS